MTKPIIFDGTEHREMTDAEYAQFQLDNAEAVALADAKAARTAAREALLDRLGITADEAQLLLGGM
jgi:hypothetical protein